MEKASDDKEERKGDRFIEVIGHLLCAFPSEQLSLSASSYLLA